MSSTCIKCGTATPSLVNCQVCSLTFHPACGMYYLKSNDQDIHICATCILLPDVSTKYSIPPSARSRSNSNSSNASTKRKKNDTEALYLETLISSQISNINEFASDFHNKESTQISAQLQMSQSQQKEYSSRQDLISALSSPMPISQPTVLDTHSSQTSANIRTYEPKPLLSVQDSNNTSIKELHEVFTANFNSLREDYNHLNNIQKVQQQDSVNFFNVIKGQVIIIQDQEVKIADLTRQIQSLKTEVSLDLMISGLDINNNNVDLKRMIVTLANFLKVNVRIQDIRKARLVNNTQHSVQVTFYSSAHSLQLLDNKRAFDRLINSNVFDYSLSNHQIFINACLSPDIHKLLMSARQVRNSFGLHKVWHKSGQIFIQ